MGFGGCMVLFWRIEAAAKAMERAEGMELVF